MAAATTSRVNHLLSAGTTNHGACLAAVVADHVLVGVHVVVPVLALPRVRAGELPVLLGLVEALEEALLLLLARHVEEELQDDVAVAGEVALDAR